MTSSQACLCMRIVELSTTGVALWLVRSSCDTLLHPLRSLRLAVPLKQIHASRLPLNYHGVRRKLCSNLGAYIALIRSVGYQIGSGSFYSFFFTVGDARRYPRLAGLKTVSVFIHNMHDAGRFLARDTASSALLSALNRGGFTFARLLVLHTHVRCTPGTPDLFRKSHSVWHHLVH